MKGYMVTQGEYSDYSVCCVFTTAELAQEYIDTRSAGQTYSSFNDIEEIEIHDAPVALVTVYSGRWADRLAEIDIWEYTTDEDTHQESVFKFGNGKGIQVSSLDKEKVIKIVSDFRAHRLAEEAGIA